jgi:hypothetical protein
VKKRILFFVLIVTLTLAAALTLQSVVTAGQEPLEEAIVGTWRFADGYYLGFDEEGRLCYGGSAESVAGKYWCNRYTFEEGIVTESCMGGPEDRNCPLGGGSCQVAVSVNESGNLNYRILYDQCDMMGYKLVPPRQFYFTKG